ncbi:MAG: hypothetical protein KBC64_01880 [Simkaniaceae bacterium]|nr:hypothetical protein [Simkaniaceae bacterium]
MKNENLSFRRVAFGLGATWALVIFIIGFLSIYGWGTDLVRLMSSIYYGYTSTLKGAFCGGLWGFIDGALFGLLFVFFHNLPLLKKTGHRKP